MGQARGRITQEEAEQYGIPTIMLLDNTNDEFSSSGTASGSLNWSISWDSGGFTGKGWNFDTDSGNDYEQLYQNGQLELTLESNDLDSYFLFIELGLSGARGCIE